MPIENLEEEGLEKNPDLQIAQWRFTLVYVDGVDKEEVKKKLLSSIKENSKYDGAVKDVQVAESWRAFRLCFTFI